MDTRNKQQKVMNFEVVSRRTRLMAKETETEAEAQRYIDSMHPLKRAEYEIRSLSPIFI